MYIIDTKSDDRYFLVISCETKQNIKIAKSCNTLEAVKRLVGLINIEKII